MRRSASGRACGLNGQLADDAAGPAAGDARERIAAVSVRVLLVASLVSAGAGAWAAGGASWAAGAVSAQPAARAGRSSGPATAALAAVWRTARGARAREGMRGVLAQRRGLGGRGDIPRALVFSPDGKILATADSMALPGCGRWLWDVATRRRIGAAMIPGGGPVLAVAFSPSGKILATDSEFKARLWDVATRRRLGHAIGTLTPVDAAVLAVAFSPRGKILATAGNENGEIRLRNVKTHRQIGRTMSAGQTDAYGVAVPVPSTST